MKYLTVINNKFIFEKKKKKEICVIVLHVNVDIEPFKREK